MSKALDLFKSSVVFRWCTFVGVILSVVIPLVTLLDVENKVAWAVVGSAAVMAAILLPTINPLRRVRDSGPKPASPERLARVRRLMRRAGELLEPGRLNGVLTLLNVLGPRVSPPPANPRKFVPEFNFNEVEQLLWMTRRVLDAAEFVSERELNEYVEGMIILLRRFESLNRILAHRLKNVALEENDKKMFGAYREGYNRWVTDLEDLLESMGARPNMAARWEFERLPPLSDLLLGTGAA